MIEHSDKPTFFKRVNDENPISSFQVFHSNISFFNREHPLDNTLFSQCGQLVKVEAEGSEQHLHMNSENGCDPGMSGMEYILDDGVRPFARRADP